jgi:hypothetical protein
MNDFYELKNKNDNLHLLAFQYHTLDYSIAVLKQKKEEYRNDPIFRRKLNNYILLQRLSFSEVSDDALDMKQTSEEYINRDDNKDLKIYFSISERIIARELDKKLLLSKVDFKNKYFAVNGHNLYCVNGVGTTNSIEFNDVEREYLYSAAKKQNRIVEAYTGGNYVSNVGYNYLNAS